MQRITLFCDYIDHIGKTAMIQFAEGMKWGDFIKSKCCQHMSFTSIHGTYMY